MSYDAETIKKLNEMAKTLRRDVVEMVGPGRPATLAVPSPVRS